MLRTLVIFLMGLSVCSSALHADPVGEARRAIQSDYNQMNAAAVRKDVSGTMAFYAPGYTSTDTHGKVTTAAQGRLAATQLFAQAQSISAKTTILSFTLNGPDQATVGEKSHLVMLLAVTAQTGGPVKLVVDANVRDLWIKTAQGWRMKHEQALTETFTANGKPLATT